MASGSCEGRVSEPKPTDPDAAEQRANEAYARHRAAGAYRRPLDWLYGLWPTYWERYFGSDERMRPPHITIGPTSGKRFSETRLTTGYGARLDIVFAERIVFGTDRRVIKTDDPDAEGVRRFLADRLLGEMVKQFVLEVHGSTEDTWDGYGPLYAREATRIGELLGREAPGEGLPEVHPRRRGPRLSGVPVAGAWPHAFRPDGYYMGHVSFSHLRLLGRSRTPGARRAVVPGVFEYLFLLAATGRYARLLDVLGREVEAAKVARAPALAAAERNPRDSSGAPLPLPVIDPDWLRWNGGCVKSIAEGIRARLAFDAMPILADALEDAGCTDPVLLEHCRAHTDHTSNCWALRLLTGTP